VYYVSDRYGDFLFKTLYINAYYNLFFYNLNEIRE